MIRLIRAWCEDWSRGIVDPPVFCVCGRRLASRVAHQHSCTDSLLLPSPSIMIYGPPDTSQSSQRPYTTWVLFEQKQRSKHPSRDT